MTSIDLLLRKLDVALLAKNDKSTDFVLVTEVWGTRFLSSIE